MIDAATMVPVHDHFEVVIDAKTYFDGVELKKVEIFDGYNHDPRCMGECGKCGGAWDVAYPMTCLYCHHGQCGGCNLYIIDQAREKGLAI